MNTPAANITQPNVLASAMKREGLCFFGGCLIFSKSLSDSIPAVALMSSMLAVNEVCLVCSSHNSRLDAFMSLISKNNQGPAKQSLAAADCTLLSALEVATETKIVA